MCFYWCDEDDNIAGFQLAVCFDCDLDFRQGTFTVEDTILDEVGAEFVTHQVDSSADDGDGCELIVGILLDALPPFEEQTVPSTGTPLKIGCIDANVSEDACGENLDIQFCDGINGTGDIPLKNLVVAVRGGDLVSVQDFMTNPCRVDVNPPPIFIRCDCNNDQKCDLADAAAVLGAVYGSYELIVTLLSALRANTGFVAAEIIVRWIAVPTTATVAS